MFRLARSKPVATRRVSGGLWTVHSANLFAEIDDGVVDAGRGAIGREERGLRHDLPQSFLVGLPIGAEVKATATANARMPAWLFMSAFSGLTFPLHRPRNRVQIFASQVLAPETEQTSQFASSAQAPTASFVAFYSINHASQGCGLPPAQLDDLQVLGFP
jgi:hypothetical protein